MLYSTLGRAALLGAASGMRSMLATALFSHRLSQRNQGALAGTALAPLSNINVSRALKALSAGEIVADKLPGIPARIQPAPLIGRAVLGALAGAGVYAEERKSPATGAVIGAVAAVAATFGAYHLRQWLDNHTGLPDPVVALTEDALAITLATQALPSARAGDR